jgi:mannose-1-phosphate guanylyltransferase
VNATADLRIICNSKDTAQPNEPLRMPDPRRWGVILAGGDGALTGTETLLKQTRRRVGRMILARQTLLLMTRTHERYYADQVGGVPPSRLLVQPENRGTAPAIACSLTRLQQMDPQALVAFFPSDHHLANDEAFITHIDFAFAQAKAHPQRVILLGIEPEAPEEAYGWIEPGTPLLSEPGNFISEVSRFWEKPAPRIASRLMHRGCLWNSFVMVGAVGAFVEMVRQALPSLIASFESMWATTTPGMEDDALRDLYLKVPATNFSEEVLSVRPSDLMVIRARGLGWSDLGEPARVLAMLRHRSKAASTKASRAGLHV